MGTAAVEAVLAVTTTARSLLVVSAVAVAVVTISVTATLATMGMSITMTSCLLPIGSSACSQHTNLSVTKSYNTSCSYFRSPKLNSKVKAGKENKKMEKTRLRKTNS